MDRFIIKDEEGFWCGRRRPNGKIVDLWSTDKSDASRFHFLEAAQKIASTIPQKVEIVHV